MFCGLCSKPADPDRLMETLPIPGKPAPETAQNGGEEVKLLLTNTPYNDKALNPPVLPVLISPKVVPQLAEMVQRLVSAGLHQQCLKIYRYESIRVICRCSLLALLVLHTDSLGCEQAFENQSHLCRYFVTVEYATRGVNDSSMKKVFGSRDFI